MSKLAHICFTLIIYKQFNFCRFRASAYTKVDRLYAVLLYNICCFHDFIETSAPTEIHWITLIHYKNDVNTENCFQNGGRPPSWIWEKVHKWSRDRYLHVILHLHSEIRINRSIRRRDIAKNTIFNMASVRHLEFEKFRFFVKFQCSEWKFAPVYQIWSKSDNSWLKYGDKAIFKMAAVRHLEFSKIAVLVT